MGDISFGGLATGMDTDSIISQLMNIERRPLTRLNSDKAYQNSRLAAFTAFDQKLQDFLDKVEGVAETTDFQTYKTTLSDDDFFSATTDTDAVTGNYQIEVHSVAQVKKMYGQGFADKEANDFGTGTITLSVGDADDVVIDIDENNNSLAGIMQAINDADAGISATIINDGTANPHRLTLTGDNAAEDFTVTFGLAGGTYNDITLTQSQPATQAHVKIDGIDVYSDSNTIADAVPGITLDLTKTDTADPKTQISMEVANNDAAIKKKIHDLVSGYNDIMSFVASQAPDSQGNAGGILQTDSSLRTIKSRLQDLLITSVNTGGAVKSLSDLGLETERDGTLTIDSEALDDAIKLNLDSVSELFAGNDSVTGIATTLNDYLDSLTDSVDGFLAGRKSSVNLNIKQIERSIELTESRLEKKETQLRAQYTALELLVSQMNSSADYLSQQMTALNNMMSQRNN